MFYKCEAKLQHCSALDIKPKVVEVKTEDG